MRTHPARWAPVAAVISIAAVAAAVYLVGPDDERDPVEVESSAEVFESLDDLVAACDLVVVATVTGVDDGRIITSAADPDAGIRTRLVLARITDSLIGEATGEVVIEEAASYADGTPIVLDGMTGLAPGDEAFWFLVAGDSDSMPYFAAVNSQARFTVHGDALEPAGADRLSRELTALGRDGLADAVVALG